MANLFDEEDNESDVVGWTVAVVVVGGGVVEGEVPLNPRRRPGSGESEVCIATTEAILYQANLFLYLGGIPVTLNKDCLFVVFYRLSICRILNLLLKTKK